MFAKLCSTTVKTGTRKIHAMPLPSNVRKTMKAAVYKAYGQPGKIESIPTPVPGLGQVLVQIYASGVCHTDVHAIDGDWPVQPPLPLIPGHEGAGVVVALGSEVKNLKVGDRVGIPWLYSTCQACEFCLSGWETLCTSQKNAGYAVPGGLGEYCIADATNAAVIPKGLSFGQAAPILCAGVTTYKGLKETEVKPGEFVTIIGAGGGLGHLAVQYAKAMGMRVIALDVGADKLAYTKRLGAEFNFDATSPTVIEDVTNATNGGSHGILCLATNKAAFPIAVKVARRKGTAVFVGLPNASCDLPIIEVVLKRVTVRGSIVGTRKDMAEALDFAARGLVKADIHIDKIDNINKIVTDLRQGKILGRTVIEFAKEKTH